MDFAYIVLTRKEYKRLKALARHPSGLPTEPNEAGLMNNHLITRNRGGSYSPDANCSPFVRSVITQEGKNYLLYRKQRNRDLLIATYGIIGGIISGVASSLIVLWLQGLL